MIFHIKLDARICNAEDLAHAQSIGRTLEKMLEDCEPVIQNVRSEIMPITESNYSH